MNCGECKYWKDVNAFGDKIPVGTCTKGVFINALPVTRYSAAGGTPEDFGCNLFGCKHDKVYIYRDPMYHREFARCQDCDTPIEEWKQQPETPMYVGELDGLDFQKAAEFMKRAGKYREQLVMVINGEDPGVLRFPYAADQLAEINGMEVFEG